MRRMGVYKEFTMLFRTLFAAAILSFLSVGAMAQEVYFESVTGMV